jgi:hypothetical protein
MEIQILEEKMDTTERRNKYTLIAVNFKNSVYVID